MKPQQLFKDLVPKGDVKGGAESASGFSGVNNRGGQDYTLRYEGVWRAISTGLGGLVIGLLLAWFTAFIGKGVTELQLEEHMKKYSPYMLDKEALQEHQRQQDRDIGKLMTRQEDVLNRVSKIEQKLENQKPN